jgi:cobalt-zinc-cadmium efflux system outer membrane protein
VYAFRTSQCTPITHSRPLKNTRLLKTQVNPVVTQLRLTGSGPRLLSENGTQMPHNPISVASLRTLVLTCACIGLCQAQQQSPAPAQLDPMTVGRTVAEAVEKNLDLMAERYNLPVADARIVTARLRPNPVLSVWGNYLDALGTGFNAATNAAGPTESGARVDFVLERGGKRRERIAVAEAGKVMAQLELLNAARTLIADVQNAFVDVLQAKADLSLAMENLKTFEEIVRINSSRVKSGDLAEVELIRSQVAQLQFENTVRQTELRLQTARAKLQLLVGRRRGDPLVDAIGEMRRDATLISFETLRAQAFAKRPDVLAERQDQARSQAELRLQLAQGKVDYTVGAAVNQQWVRGLDAGNSMGVFFSMPLPLYNRNQGEIARAQQERLQAEARIRAIETTIENEVKRAYLQYQNARTTLGRIEESLFGRAQDVRRVTEFSYRRGEATFLEFLDAQRAYNETVQAHNEARADFARSLYSIDAATGLNLEEQDRR